MLEVLYPLMAVIQQYNGQTIKPLNTIANQYNLIEQSHIEDHINALTTFN